MTIMISGFASNKDISNQENVKSPEVQKQQLSQRQLAYQRWKKAIEKENKQLEDDGFCDCNNY